MTVTGSTDNKKIKCPKCGDSAYLVTYHYESDLDYEYDLNGTFISCSSGCYDEE